MEYRGQIKKIIFRNNRTGYTNFLFETQDSQTIFCSGVIPKYTEKTPLLILGHEETYEKNNRTNNIFLVENSMFYYNNRKMLKEYLSNHLCHGIGAATVDKILELCNDDFEKFIYSDDAKEKLMQIKNISESMAVLFLAKVKSSLIMKKIYEELFPYGGSYRDAEVIYRQYYEDSLNQLQRNPYFCNRNLEIPFGVIDSYAKNKGFLYYDTQRVILIANLAFQKISMNGNTYENYPEMLKIARNIEINQGIFEQLIPEAILAEQLLKAKYGVVQQEEGEIRFYSKYLFQAEENIVKQLRRINEKPQAFLPLSIIDKAILEENELDETQKTCYKMLAQTGISIVIGGPGTGKTSTIKKLIQLVKANKPETKIALCAPSGRAAERITETSGLPASTIHMLLEFQSQNGEAAAPMRTESNPLEQDIIVVDEFSMVGTVLFSQLLNALKTDCILICVGDENQLKSVDAGKVLSDMLKSQKFPVYRFTNIHRQEANNSIILNSRKIVNRQTDLITDESFQIIRKNTPSELQDVFKEIMQKEYDTSNIFKVQSLGIMKDRLCGVNHLNEESQDLFSDKTQPKFYNGSAEFFIGDKIMTVRNNYDQGYMNGDIGKLSDFTPNQVYMEIKPDNQKEILAEDINDLILAYAMTVHKSQGSEADVVILVIPYDIPQTLLENSLIYVGVTRAKKKVYVLSEMNALEKGILNIQGSQRKTGLLLKLKERFS